MKVMIAMLIVAMPLPALPHQGTNADSDAVKARKAALSALSDAANGKLRLSEEMLIAGKHRLAHAHCDEALAMLQPTGQGADFNARLLRAEINLAEGDYREAIAEFTDLISYNRHHPRITMGLAIAHASAKKPFPKGSLENEYREHARYLVEKSEYLNHFPSNVSKSYKHLLAEALLLRGRQFHHENKFKRAILDFKKAHLIVTNSQIISLMYAYSLESAGDKPAAIAQARLAAKGNTAVSKAAKNLLYRLGVDD